MADDIPYNKVFTLEPGRAEEVAPGVRRIVANNPGSFTFKGTVSYIVGHGNVAIIDPGPADAAHSAALLDAVRGETVTHIFVTHTHRDHSPAVPAVKAATGAAVYAEGPHRASRPLNAGEAPRMEASNDMDFLFSGDHVMGWSTTIVAPPDGAMTDYMDSLGKLSRRDEQVYLPGHGNM